MRAQLGYETWEERAEKWVCGENFYGKNGLRGDQTRD